MVSTDQHKVTDIDSFGEDLASSLTLGCFPRDVASYEHLQVPLEQLVYFDYLISSLCDTDSIRLNHGSPANHSQDMDALYKSIHRLREVTIELQGSSSVEVALYSATIIAHWYYLVGDYQKVKSSISPVELAIPTASDNLVIARLLSYLQLRLMVLKGLCDDFIGEPCFKFLSERRSSFTMSETASRSWLKLLFTQIITQMKASEPTRLSFSDFMSLPFISNQLSAIELGCYLMTQDGQKYVDADFPKNLKSHISSIMKASMKANHPFPRADLISNELEGLIGALSIAMSAVDFDVVDPKLLHSALIDFTSKTYQSQVVMSRLVESLADRGDYDEALAAFGAYVGYLQNDEQQQAGRISDIVSTVHAYTVCFSQFTPAAFSEPGLRSTKGFKHYTEHDGVETLNERSRDFVRYLHIIEAQTGSDINYDPSSPLSFMDSCTTIIPPELRQLIARAWLSLGQFSQYMASRRCLTRELLDKHISLLLKRYHSGLSYTSSGNLTLLHSYAFALAHERQLDPALRLCKHILKIYPNAFKTWNLMVLIMLAKEQKHSSNGEPLTQDPTKWISNALNVASLYLTQAQEDQTAVPDDIKKDILELKITQCAVRESVSDIRSAMEQVPQVFAFFDELYDDHANVARPDMMDYVTEKSLKPHQSKTDDKRLHERLHSLVAKLLRHSIINIARTKSRTKVHGTDGEHGNAKIVSAPAQDASKRLLQYLWLWLSKMYMRLQMLDESEHCIVEAESAWEPNLSTFNALALLVSETRSHLALQEYERVLEQNGTSPLHTLGHGDAIVGMSRLFLECDSKALFISDRDEMCGILRVKNLLEQHLLSWPHGTGNSEVWFYLSKIYERIDDADLMSVALWRCVDLEDSRPVRSFAVAS